MSKPNYLRSPQARLPGFQTARRRSIILGYSNNSTNTDQSSEHKSSQQICENINELSQNQLPQESSEDESSELESSQPLSGTKRLSNKNKDKYVIKHKEKGNEHEEKANKQNKLSYYIILNLKLDIH